MLLSRCNTDYLQILCADDKFYSQQSVGLLKELIANKISSAISIWKDNTNSSYKDKALADRLYIILSSDRVLKDLFLFGCFPGGLSNILVNLALLKPDNYFDSAYQYGGDYNFYIRIGLSGSSMTLVNKILVARKNWSGNVSSTMHSQHKSVELAKNTRLLEVALAGMGYPLIILHFYRHFVALSWFYSDVRYKLLSGNLKFLPAYISSSDLPMPVFFLYVLLSIFVRQPIRRIFCTYLSKRSVAGSHG
jgi:hypothetical protein